MSKSSPASNSSNRTVGLIGATQVGIGAIVGGGILALGGVAFELSGPSAILAFALNGMIAILTALSFAEISTAFPESGGLYNFAKKVLSVRSAFASGWILWLAYMVAGVLYALGFATYAIAGIENVILAFGGEAPVWFMSRQFIALLSTAAVGMYLFSLVRKNTGGGGWIIWGKVLIFIALIAAGMWVLIGNDPVGTSKDAMTPFFTGGGFGLLQAMGYTFIALQGFDLIAAIAGEVKNPAKVIPRAMILALACALLIYLPFLFVTATVGIAEGETIASLSAANPETVMAIGVERYLGIWGYRLVIIVAILAMLSALQANMMAASRVAMAMANDGTLPPLLSRFHSKYNTPSTALYASAIGMVAILLMLPNLATAGAAASLIFLLSFALVHGTSYLARIRSKGIKSDTFRTPLFPAIPFIGGAACLGLAVFQIIVAPSGGGIALMWLGMGVILYLVLFASRAERIDAFSQGLNPDLVQLRGKSPLVLVPVSNPKTAGILTDVANALAPPRVGRVLLLTVMRPGEDEAEQSINNALAAIREGLTESFESEHRPEALLSTASDPWAEIARVAESHRCESLLLGMSAFDAISGNSDVERLVNELSCDVIVVRTPSGWTARRCKRIVVPVGGNGEHDELRARFLGSLMRMSAREIVFIRVVPPTWQQKHVDAALKKLKMFASDETNGKAEARVIRSAHIENAITQHLEVSDMVVLGLSRAGKRQLFGDLALRIAKTNPGMTLMISHNDDQIKLPFLSTATFTRPVKN